MMFEEADNPFYYKRSEEHTSELQSLRHLVCRLLLEKKKQKNGAETLTQNVCRLQVNRTTRGTCEPRCTTRVNGGDNRRDSHKVRHQAQHLRLLSRG